MMYVIDSRKLIFKSEVEEREQYRVQVIFQEYNSERKIFMEKVGGKELMEFWALLDVNDKDMQYEDRTIEMMFGETCVTCKKKKEGKWEEYEDGTKVWICNECGFNAVLLKVVNSTLLILGFKDDTDRIEAVEVITKRFKEGIKNASFRGAGEVKAYLQGLVHEYVKE